MKVPSLTDMRSDYDALETDWFGLNDWAGWLLDILEGAGITDDDLPDELSDDALMEWPEGEAAQLEWWRKYFPAATAKLEAN
ncbi:hypothetical protein PP713_14165 [Mycobacterium sp. CSUR Q5927]|nr:hypothetical protein [Mycobacterium sp. CSUR Q5927]